jgi:ADP-heptose:LPS heptosyltransferase
MKQETIRRIDAFVGTVLCALLTVVRRVIDLVRRRSSFAPPRRVLFFKLIEQGATVLACDAIRLGAERVGRDNVYFCVFAENRFILDVLDLVAPENIFCIRSDRFRNFLPDIVRALVRIRRSGIDAVVDMEFFSRASAIVAFLSGARLRAGLHRFTAEGPYRGDLLTHRVQHSPYLHVSQLYRLLVDALWTEPADVPLLKSLPAPIPAPPSFSAAPEERQRVRAMLDALAGAPVRGPLVVLHPNTDDRLPLRRWPDERFCELGRRLLAERPGLLLAMTGAPSEQTAIDRLCESLGPRALPLAGRTTLREVLVLYTLADVLVTSDSGPGHFASLTDLHAIVLFGPETPQVFGPLGERSHALSAGLACSPCFNAHNNRFSPCTRNVCLEAISVDDVLARVRAALAEREALRPRRQGAA